MIFLLSVEELTHILRDSEARAVITTPEFLPNVKLAAEGVETLKWIISTGPEEDGVIPLTSLETQPGDVVRAQTKTWRRSCTQEEPPDEPRE